MKKVQKMDESKRKLGVEISNRKNPKLSAALKVSEAAKVHQDRFRFNNPMKNTNQKGENNGNFKGYKDYASLHASLRVWYGIPIKCEFCGKLRDETKRRNIDWANVTGEYRIERENWKPLCVDCHTRFDKWVVVIYSGGLDSTTLLYWLKKQEKVHIKALSFDYNQRHKKELEAAKATCERLNIEHKIVDITSVNQLMQGSSLTSDIVVPHGHYEDETMRQTVVPNRNMILLSLATAYAVSLKAGRVYTAVHAGDHAVYPDCRPEFIKTMSELTKIANYVPVTIQAPFLNIDKGDIAKIGRILGVDYSLSWTCYEGKEVPCGKCGACQERAYAFEKAGTKDPLLQ